jgi:cell division protein FtsI/penicillin-binding protein 2
MKLLSFNSRIKFVIICIFFAAIILLIRLFFIQIIHNNLYIDRADKQYVTPASNIFDRGSIFFSKKDGSLITAGTITSGFKLAVVPKNIENPEDTYLKLSQYLKIDKETFFKKIAKIDDPYEEVATRLTKEQINEIENLKIKGLSIFKDNWRFYPSGSLASHTLGFLAFKENSLIGQYGLERYYNSVLSKPKDVAYVNFFAEVFSNIRDTISDSNQGDIITTIEPLAQSTLEQELKATFEKWKSTGRDFK